MNIKDTPAKLLLLTACTLSAMSVMAVEYKWLDDNGGVVYGDNPPAEGAVPLRSSGGTVSEMINPAKQDPMLAFPLDLRTAARAQPVVLYSAEDCQPCNLARQHLKNRGIPFQEWLVSSHADFEKFRSLGFTSNGFPALGIGQSRQVGFEANAWDRALDGAGYPKERRLPSSYQYPAVSRLSEEPATQGDVVLAQPQNQIVLHGSRPSTRAARPATTAASPETPAIRF
ncbi:MAG: glutaredoxin family protein [Lautropia sp.]|nr:glutaredoxin family protein [Lautropia sp.]